MKFSDTIVQDSNVSITWITNLRLLAMFAVVVLHTASPLLMNYNGVRSSDWVAGDVYNSVTRFAVPVFVMITGALLFNREFEIFGFYKKRIGRLIVPFLFWSLVYVGYQWYEEIIYFNGDAWANVLIVIRQLKTGTYYHLWYIYLLIGLYLFIPFLGKFVRNATERELLYFLAIWFFTTLISRPYLSYVNTAVELRYFSGYIGYLVLGYYLAYKRFAIPYLIFPSLLIFTACVVLITCGNYYLQVANHTLSTFFYEPIGPFVIVLATGAFMAAKHLIINLGTKLSLIIANASKYTLGIYLSHALILDVLELNDINYKIFNPWLSIPLVALACFLLSWLLIYILSKLPIIKYVVG
ncbi:acyltransferase [Mucilaginibacter sp.]|uniref:acyltransferase n=1 Tax=Mucilaginibacter sp. TaxID=1882438 RepID=UPI0035BC5945